MIRTVLPATLCSGRAERLWLVEDFVRATGAFEDPQTFTSQGLPRPEDDPYAGEIAYVDQCIGRVLDRLRNTGDHEVSDVAAGHGRGDAFGHRPSQLGQVVVG